MTTVYTFSQACRKLADVLERARAEGEVRIRRRDGAEFTVRSTQATKSPLDVKGASTGLAAEEIVDFVRAVRERGPSADLAAGRVTAGR